MGTARAVHLYTAIVFALAVLVRNILVCLPANGYARLTSLSRLSRRRLRSLLEDVFCTNLLHSRHTIPTTTRGHNGLAGRQLTP